jgi:hypothetical protein
MRTRLLFLAAVTICAAVFGFRPEAASAQAKNPDREAEILIGVNASGNARNRPVGSGFWIAAVDKSECGAQAAGLWGCRFDTSGNETACGVATIDERNDDIVIAAVQK